VFRASFIIRLFFLSILVFFTAAPVNADSDLIPHHALAMHGAPKYDSDFTHLSYVNPAAPKGGKIRQSVSGTFDTLNPYTLKGNAAQGLNLFYDRLMQRVWDEPFTMYPLVAEQVHVAEDRSAIKFALNDKARFRDGSPITPADILYSFETLKEFGRPNMRRIYSLVSDVQINTEENSITFTLGEGYDQETIMILAMMPVLSKTWWSAREFNETLLTLPLSSGPYMITDAEPGRHITYERDPDYWAANLPVNVGQYNFDKITYDYFRDETAAFEAFKAGDIDLRREWNAGKWASSYDFPSLQNGTVLTEEIAHQRPERVQSLIFNTRRAPFDDIRVRKALSNLIDFKWINDSLFHGKYNRIESFFPNSALAAPPAPSDEEIALLSPWKDSLPPEIFKQSWTAPYAKDNRALRLLLKEADTLLKESGWIIENGQRIHKDTAETFSFKILIASPEDKKVILSFIQQLERVGITANVRMLDDANFQSRLNNYDYDMVLYQWRNSLSPGTEQILYWSCESANIKHRWNYPGICHPAVDSLTAKIANAQTRSDLVTSAHALDRVLTWGHYVIPLFYAGYDMVAYETRIKRPEITPIYGMVIESWWIEE